MRYIEVTHTYVIPVPVDDVDSIDPVANAGVSMMEGFIKDRAKNIADLRSDWKMMPASYRPLQPVQDLVAYDDQQAHLAIGTEMIDGDVTYDKGHVPKKIFTDTPHERDRVESLHAIENDLDQGISFTGDVMWQNPKVTHPWDQGSRVTPVGHELFDAETEALRQEGMLCAQRRPRFNAECVFVKGHPGNHLFEFRGGTDVIEGEAKEITDGKED